MRGRTAHNQSLRYFGERNRGKWGEGALAAQADKDVGIVVVDDDRANVELLRRMLTRAGYREVVATTDPAEAIELSRRETTGLLLLDLHMPGADGFEVMAAVLEQSSALRVIVTTGDVAPDVLERATDAGACSVLIKPFEYEELLTQVARQIGDPA